MNPIATLGLFIGNNPERMAYAIQVGMRKAIAHLFGLGGSTGVAVFLWLGIGFVIFRIGAKLLSPVGFGWLGGSEDKGPSWTISSGPWQGPHNQSSGDFLGPFREYGPHINEGQQRWNGPGFGLASYSGKYGRLFDDADF